MTGTSDCVKDIPGFTAKEHTEKEIASNGTTVVDIYYVRNQVSLTVSIGEGEWNYVQRKNDSSIPADKEGQVFAGKFGESPAPYFAELLDNCGKKACTLTKFSTSTETEVEALPDNFPAGDCIYTAIWEEGKIVRCKIYNYFVKADWADSSVETAENYELVTDYAQTKLGIPETETQTGACVRQTRHMLSRTILQNLCKENLATPLTGVSLEN